VPANRVLRRRFAQTFTTLNSLRKFDGDKLSFAFELFEQLRGD
jgi:hypothetical protein